MHWGGEFPVKLPVSWRDKHVYIVGRSGSGKTNLLKQMIFQDLTLGNGIGVLAPELELLTEGILPYIPRHRIDDVVFINPADTQCPVPFNPLHLDEGEDIDRKRDDMTTIFKRLLADTNTPRMDAILSRSFHALLERPGSTLLDIERLIDPYDDSFRKEIIRTSKNERTINFFRVINSTFAAA